jgi:hypothetical protein
MIGSILRPGDVLGGYQIDDVLGIGGMAVVYRATQVALQRPIALKVVNAALSRDEVFRERFRREGQHVASLDHPHIVPVYVAGEIEGTLFMAMRLVEGGTLADRLAEGPMEVDQALAILVPIASALGAAHDAGLVHRDVKPHNVLITPSGHPYLTDFGVARGPETRALTRTGAFVGSIDYSAPEQIRGESPTPAADFYALSGLLVHCVTGRAPYPRDADAAVMHAHLSEPPPVFEGRGRLTEFVAHGMAKDPAERIASAQDWVEAARELALPEPEVSVAPVAISTPLRAPEPEPVVEPQRVVEPAPVVEEPEPAPAVERGPAPPKTVAPPPAAPPRPAPLAPAPRSARQRRNAAGIGLVVALVAAVLLTVPRGEDRPKPPAPKGKITVGSLSLRVGAPWSGRPPTPGPFALEEAVDVHAGPAVLRMGAVSRPAAVPGGIPRDLEFLTEPDGEVIDFGGVPANALDGSTSDGRVYVLVVSTSKGDLAVSCEAPDEAALARCTDVAREVRLDGPEAFPPGPLDATAAALTQAVGRLNRVRRTRDLTGRSMKKRGRAARRIAAADRSAAPGLAALGPRPAEQEAAKALSAALADEAVALSGLAGAGRSGYPGARRKVRATQAEVRSALARFRAIGYEVPRLTTIRTAGYPAPTGPATKPPPVETVTPPKPTPVPPKPPRPTPTKVATEVATPIG